MCNSGQRRRSPDRMLMHQTLSKGWCRDGSGLLLGLIVRPRGRLVEARARSAAAEEPVGPPCSAIRRSSPWPSSPSSGPASEARGTSGASLGRTCAPTSLPSVRRAGSIGASEPWSRRCASCSSPSAVYRVMDTTLVPAMVRVRASRKGLFCGQATFGRSASKTEWV
jgi:hypothetical protein